MIWIPTHVETIELGHQMQPREQYLTFPRVQLNNKVTGNQFCKNYITTNTALQNFLDVILYTRKNSDS